MTLQPALLPDRDLISRAKAGDNTAFGLLWSRYEPQVVSLCRRYLSGPGRDPMADEQDLALETFVRALHQLDRYEDRSGAGTGFHTWLLEVAKRICLRSLEKGRRRQQW